MWVLGTVSSNVRALRDSRMNIAAHVELVTIASSRILHPPPEGMSGNWRVMGDTYDMSV